MVTKIENEILLCNIYFECFTRKSSRFKYTSSVHIKNCISTFFNTDISDEAFTAVFMQMFEYRHEIDNHYFLKIILKSPKSNKIRIGAKTFNQYSAMLFEWNGIFYKPTYESGNLAFEEILVNNKKIQNHGTT